MYGKLNTKVGILGGGQLGKMLSIAAAPWHLPISFLEPSAYPPVYGYTPELIKGSLNATQDILKFGENKEVLSIEIEHVNVQALYQLQKNGVKIFPQPHLLEMIQDKGQQKNFYKLHHFPTSPFQIIEDKNELLHKIGNAEIRLPFVQKLRKGGYDGKGVLVVQTPADFKKLFDAPSIIEDLVPIQKEIAIIGARNSNGEFNAFPPVEMEFNQDANLVEFLSCPAAIDKEMIEKGNALVANLMHTSGLVGLLAVEFFLTKGGELLINEIAPRPHNSGHHTIESCKTSQFEQHLRAILGLPLGSTEMLCPSIMLNILGGDGYEGTPTYNGLEKAMEIEGVHVHIYGKKTTKPFRKMGHITITADTSEEAKVKAIKVKEMISVTA